jgi:hypothetical protein
VKESNNAIICYPNTTQYNTTSGVFAVPKNLGLVAVPLFDLFDGSGRFGSELSVIPQLLSRIHMTFITDDPEEKSSEEKK